MINGTADISPLTKWVKNFLVQKIVHNFVPPFEGTPNLVTYKKGFNNDVGVTPGGGGRGTPGGGVDRQPSGICTPGGNSLGTWVSNANVDPRCQDSAMRGKIVRGRIKTPKVEFEWQDPPI